MSLILAALLDVAVALLVAVSYKDAKDTPNDGAEDIEYILAAFMGFCVSTAFCAIMSVVGEAVSNYKLVVAYKYSTVLKILSCLAVVAALISLEDDVCPEAKNVNWYWYSFKEDDRCSSHVMVMLTLPVVLFLILAVIVLVVATAKADDLRSNDPRLNRSPTLHSEADVRTALATAERVGEVGPFKPSAVPAHVSLSPRARANEDYFDNDMPLNGSAAARKASKHNPQTGFYYAA